MKIAIHQPNFLPWFPFFQKMIAADAFVLLNRCQFEKGKYQNRFRLEDKWYTMSVNHGLQPIREKRYVNAIADWQAIRRRLPQFASILQKCDHCVSDSLSATNTKIIGVFRDLLGVTTPLHFDGESDLTGTDRLIHICRGLGATVYLAGKSGAKYLDERKFVEAGIQVEYQDLARSDRRHTLEVLNERLEPYHP